MSTGNIISGPKRTPKPSDVMNLSTQIDNDIKKFHMSNDTLRIAEDNVKRVENYNSPKSRLY